MQTPNIGVGVSWIVVVVVTVVMITAVIAAVVSGQEEVEGRAMPCEKKKTKGGREESNGPANANVHCEVPVIPYARHAYEYNAGCGDEGSMGEYLGAQCVVVERVVPREKPGVFQKKEDNHAHARAHGSAMSRGEGAVGFLEPALSLEPYRGPYIEGVVDGSRRAHGLLHELHGDRLVGRAEGKCDERVGEHEQPEAEGQKRQKGGHGDLGGTEPPQKYSNSEHQGRERLSKEDERSSI